MKTAFEIAMEKDTGYDPNAPSPSSGLTRKQLIACINGSTPSYQMINAGLVSINGTYTGGFVDKWEWNDLSSKTDAELQELYDTLQA